MSVANPLVVAATDSAPGAWSGVYLAEDIQLLHEGVKSGSWVESSLGGVGTTLDAFALATDPLGTLGTWGVAWLLEHVEPLRQALDQLAGDAGQIQANAQTWRNAGSQLTAVADDYNTAVTRQLASWTGPAADAYRIRGAEYEGNLRGLAEAHATMGTIVEASGMLVALVRTLVRDLIAEFVSVLAVRLWVWLAEAAGTFGAGIPLVVAQVAALVAKWANKIAHFLRALVSSLRRLQSTLQKLAHLVENLARKGIILSRITSDRLFGHYHCTEDLIGIERLKHILSGEGLFREWWKDVAHGGHVWPGLRGKTSFPRHWKVEDIRRYVADIATDPASFVTGARKDGQHFSADGNPVRISVYGTRDGVQLRVIIEPGGEGIITVYPWPQAPV